MSILIPLDIKVVPVLPLSVFFDDIKNVRFEVTNVL